MSILIQGRVVDYTVGSTVLSRTPAESYTAWATELGVPSTASLYSLDADDTGFPIDFAAPPVSGGTAAGLFSSEGGLGWYLSGSPGTSTPATLEGVSRFYQLTKSPDFLLVFHPQVDCKSNLVKLQKAGEVTIITGEIRGFSSSSEITEFSARFNGATDWQLDVRVVAGTLPLAFFSWQQQWSNRPGTQRRVDLATMTVGQSLTLTGVASIGTVVSSPAPNILLAQALRLVKAVIPAVSCTVLPPAVKLFDTLYGGKGRIAGTIKEAGTPDHAVKRRVRLHRKIDGMMLFETWSKPDGTYLFENIQIQPYYVVSFDHTGNYNGVIKDSIIPELMP